MVYAIVCFRCKKKKLLKGSSDELPSSRASGLQSSNIKCTSGELIIFKAAVLPEPEFKVLPHDFIAIPPNILIPIY